MNESCHIWMSHVTYEWVMSHMNESCHIWMSHVTWTRPISHTIATQTYALSDIRLSRTRILNDTQPYTYPQWHTAIHLSSMTHSHTRILNDTQPYATRVEERAGNICLAQQSVHFLSWIYSEFRIIARDSHSNLLKSEDTEYNLLVYRSVPSE